MAIIVWSCTVDKLYPVAYSLKRPAAGAWGVELNTIRKENLSQMKISADFAEYTPGVPSD